MMMMMMTRKTTMTRMSNVTVADCARHITELARLFNVEIVWVDSENSMHMLDRYVARTTLIRDGEVMRALHEPNDVQRVYILPITSFRFYAAALHEFGHLLHPTGSMYSSMSVPARQFGEPVTSDDFRFMMLAERSAWSWAMKHALIWTNECTLVRNEAYGSYKLGLRKLAVKI